MIEKMPKEFLGKVGKITEYTHTAPREWTQREIEWLLEKHKQGYNSQEIAYSMERTPVSVSIKLKRITKKDDTYNKKHLEDKYEFNKVFLEQTKPTTILDVYCGQKSYYKNLNQFQVISNDIDKKIDADYHLDSLKLLCKLYSENQTYDLIDLDPFGSAYDCFDLAIKMAKKCLVITLGEIGHKRWKRLDFVERYYDIKNLESFTLDNLISHIQKIGLRNKKELKVVFKKEWQNIARVWFVVEPLKILKTQIKQKQVEQLTLFEKENL